MATFHPGWAQPDEDFDKLTAMQLLSVYKFISSAYLRVRCAIGKNLIPYEQGWDLAEDLHRDMTLIYFTLSRKITRGDRNAEYLLHVPTRSEWEENRVP